MSTLAIHGGSPTRTKPFPDYVTIGQEEKDAVAQVLDSTVLSKFLGDWSPDFFGGPRVQKVEREWEKYFGVQYAITVNSATSGLNAAIGAAGIGPGDEVIVSPYTMSASAACAMVYNAVPVFADIDPVSFCITAETIRKVLTPRTKGIVVVDIFGHPAEMDAIMELARERGIVVIEDAAQAPGAKYKGRWAGTLADMGVFSLNYHKTIHSGEGGVVVTDNPTYAERLQLIRNHAEAVVEAKGVKNIANMLGFNYRMTEIEAAIASAQLQKLEKLLLPRIEAADFLSAGLRGLPGLTVPTIPSYVRHGYYVYALKYDETVSGVPRAAVAAALRAEGVPIGEGYVRPIYLQPMYQQQKLFGSTACPFRCGHYSETLSYARGLCPVTERMHYREVLLTDICHAGVSRSDLGDFVNGFEKVFQNMDKLRA